MHGQLNRDLFDQRVNPNFAAVIAGMAKIFVADVVELGRHCISTCPITFL